MFPRAYKKLRRLGKQRKKILASTSLGSLLGFIAFTPAIVTFDKLLSDPQLVAIIGLGYLLAIFFFTMLACVVSKMGLAEELFKDYCEWSLHIHLTIIIGSIGGVLALVWAKLYVILYPHSTLNDKPTNGPG